MRRRDGANSARARIVVEQHVSAAVHLVSMNPGTSQAPRGR
jgi:hypothetical protein